MRQMRCFGLLVVFAMQTVVIAVTPAQSSSASQSVSPQHGHRRHAESANSTDIIVRGIPEGPFAVKIKPNNGTAADPSVERQAAADSRLFVRCITPSDATNLRDVLDGVPNSPIRAAALDRIIRNHPACYPGLTPHPMWKETSYGDCNPRGEFAPVIDPYYGVVGAVPVNTICQAFFDRGAIVEKVLAMYAPDLSFTTEQLAQPEVLARYRAREDHFNKQRTKKEQTYAGIVACFVAANPALALQYPRAAINGAVEVKLRNALIGMAPDCVGGVRQVNVDPAEFRVFVADAIYSWAVALRGTDSLIPAR